MTQDLRIINKTLTPEDSDVSSNFTIPASANQNFGSPCVPSNTAYNPGNSDGSIIYTWYTATATIQDLSSDTSTSICSKNWRLPTRFEFSTLASLYDSSAIKNNPANFKEKNICSGASSAGGAACEYGNSGQWHTSNAASSVNSWVFRNHNVDNNNCKSNGFLIRCIYK